MKLSDLLLSSENKPSLIKDCAKLIEDEVNSKSGISGLSIKTVFKLVKGVKPGILDELLDKLVPEFTREMEPFHERFQNSGEQDFNTYLKAHAEEVTQALLQVTDRRAAVARTKVLKTGYEKLRGLAEKQVRAAVPKFSEIISKYARK